ncbi:MAG: flagellar filament capping protein FliD [Terracidiphilus sp.]
MGTVGLSFGSPTSGAGFDVNATVSSIVANLQKVETPWKSQLSGLESQDTVISSLGTLLSNLSNDLTSLTDFTGVMAQKTGSSSDTNVLELTSATSSAVAGTHTVVVNKLAQTSSGFLTEILNPSDTLKGSMTITVGSGKPQTISLPSAGGTLQSLMTAINSSGAGVTANVLTDATGSRLSIASGTSGAKGTVIVTSNFTDATLYPNGINLAYADTTAAGESAHSGAVTAIPNGSDPLTGDLSIAGPSGTATDFQLSVLASGQQNLAGLAGAINTAAIGVTASVVANSDGSAVLSLQSTGALSVTSNLSDVAPTLGYTSTMQGADASLTIDGVQNLTSSSNTVSNLIPGLTFQLLSTSPKQSDGTLEPVQVVIGNDNTGVESTVATMVSDYNSLVSAINTQEGNDASGTPEPLFGSPTLSLLQQQLLGMVNTQNPNGSLDAITANTATTLAGSITIQVSNGTRQTFTVGSGSNGTNAFYTGSGANSNTLAGLAAAINAANVSTSVSYAGTAASDAGDGTSATTSIGTLVADSSANLSGSIAIQVGDGATTTIQIGDAPAIPAAHTIYTGDSTNFTLQDLAEAITNNAASLGVSANVTTTSDGVATLALTSGTAGSAGTLTINSQIEAAGLGVTAQVETSNNMSYLMLKSGTSGSNGAISVTSQIAATSNQLLSYIGSAGLDATALNVATYSSGALSGIPDQNNDTLSGALTLQVGNSPSQTIVLGSATLSDGTVVNTLSSLAQYIGQNTQTLGLTANIVQNSVSGTFSLALQANTVGSGGSLTVTSTILDTSNKTTTSLNYSNSSDVSSLGALGVSMNNDGTISFDATSLDALLNTDFNGVAGLFQGTNSWGKSFASMLTNAGTTSTTGLLKLAQNSNSNIESTLQADISKEEMLISSQQKSLTAELNSANEVLQALPSQISEMDMLYSAITGYNRNSNG